MVEDHIRTHMKLEYILPKSMIEIYTALIRLLDVNRNGEITGYRETKNHRDEEQVEHITDSDICSNWSPIGFRTNND